jgi:hypothetical protein
MVMRASNRRPKVRHLTLQEAQDEARRVAANNAGADVWVIECATIETHRTEVAAVPAQDGTGKSS